MTFFSFTSCSFASYFSVIDRRRTYDRPTPQEIRAVSQYCEMLSTFTKLSVGRIWNVSGTESHFQTNLRCSSYLSGRVARGGANIKCYLHIPGGVKGVIKMQVLCKAIIFRGDAP